MNAHGGSSEDLLVASRTAMLDALAALDAQRDAVIVIGAQAIYLRTSAAPVALAEATKDSDLALDPRSLNDAPLIEEAMTQAGFYLNPISNQPGAWLSPKGVPVDLMVPETLAGKAGKQARGARIPPHSKTVARRARGLEAALVDNSSMEVFSLDTSDNRSYTAAVAGPGALLVAKLYKIAERVDFPTRLVDKDAHDIYRILVDIETEALAEAFRRLNADPISSQETGEALQFLDILFAKGPSALGSAMAGRAETGIGEPVTVALQVSVLAADLVAATRS
ncbi:hypothetical protein [Tenggerimyces flavus]|uniref:Nucleotidyltransferase n=1 Tax=Tenggerimyces flavus TaxID=1708749 RepID=A0ABV7YBX0_9ACTN|nr:hypothetical protein [Tenggerimyces flavus]MBM7783659.1 hypothetical protein [Tenggerimyces flavus]